jgi:hypothetical protein
MGKNYGWASDYRVAVIASDKLGDLYITGYFYNKSTLGFYGNSDLNQK